MTISKAATFLRKIKEAVESRAAHADAFEVFNEAIDKDSTAEWTRVVVAWEDDNSKFNPFVAKEKGEHCSTPSHQISDC